ncbi:MAG: 23S rRNA (uracil(1939)-C(5))-methyltransferase RlmD [Candidatus Schekmanbacteria bacterium]|nr:MAG: 23S rRNA (uracil(1939)-C(5))-methyltransferase RlmD [Candidatus Schekmanbacteria bacterium]
MKIEEIVTRIDKAVYGGYGLGHFFDKVVLIPKTIPGETVKVEIIDDKKDYLLGKVVGFIKSSTFRRNPPCPYYSQCGGCHYQHIEYNYQTKIKEDIVKETFKRVGGIEDIEVNSMITSPSEFGYRNRVELKVTRKVQKNEPYLGFYMENSHKIVPIARCLLCGNRINELIEALNFYSPIVFKKNCENLKLIYSASSDKLLLKAIGKNLNKRTMENALNDLKKYVKGISGIVFGYGNKKNSFGKEYVYERIKDIKYRVNSDSFFQINNLLHEVLLETVIKIFKPKKKEKILDLYSGVGTFSLPLAQKSSIVVGIESNKDAVDDAKFNAKSNKITNISFIEGDAAEELEGALKKTKFDSIFINPPRSGCSTEVKKILSKAEVSKIFYLSCNPSTLARDLKQFLSKGFKIKTVQPFDLFPQTMHIETAVLLSRES